MLSNKLYRYDADIWYHENHWGEFGNREKDHVNAERVNTLIIAAVKNETPKDYFYSVEEENEGSLKLTPEQCPMNEVVRHTVRLNFYAKKIQRFLKSLTVKKTEHRGPSIHELRKVPEMIMKRKDRPLRIHKFGVGQQASPLPALHNSLILEMLEKAVIIMLAQAGFDQTRKAAFDLLVDIVKEFMTKLCQFCHAFAQKDLSRGQVCYDDVLDKSLRSVGFDGIESIKEYYNKSILYQREKALARAKQLRSILQEKLKTRPNLISSNDNIPEIHFPATGKQNSEAVDAILKRGFKMLQTFDQETQQSNSAQNQS